MLNLPYNLLVRNSLFLFLIFISLSCEDVFEKDISNLEVKLIAPGDNVSTQTTLVSFRWELMNGVSNYRLQVATPSIDNPVRFILDTLVSGTKFDLILNQGKYQWQVRGENGSSTTKYSKRIIEIDSLTDLSQQIIQLKTPLNNLNSNASTFYFSWDNIAIADQYMLEIRKDSWTGVKQYSNSSIEKDSITITLPEGLFFWGVRAINSNGFSPFSSPNQLLVDRTIPQTSVPQTPQNGLTITSFPINFTWDKFSDGGAVCVDSIIISLDNMQDNSVVNASVTTMNQFTLDSLPIGNYQWKLKTIDLAGNQSVNYSSIFRFNVK